MEFEIANLLKKIIDNPEGIYVYTDKIKQNGIKEIWCSDMNFDTIHNNWEEINKLVQELYESRLYYYEKTYYPGDQEVDVYVAATKNLD